MRILAKRSLDRYGELYPDAIGALKRWSDITSQAKWATPQELKVQVQSASILNDARVVFNIHGNKYRLIVGISYQNGIVFIKWFGPHKDYDKIDARTAENFDE